MKSAFISSIALVAALAWSSLAAAEAPVIPPSPITRVDASYPADVAPTTVDVDLAIEIDDGGRVAASEVVKSGGAPFDAAAIAAAKQWTFNPATRAGSPVRSRIRLSFHFEPPASPPPPAPAPTPPATPDAPASTTPAPQPSPAATTPSAPSEPSPSEPPQPPATAPAAPPSTEEPVEVTVIGKRPPPSRGVADFELTIGALARVPRQSAAQALTLAPGILLQNDGGEGHAEQVFMRGFDAGEGADIEFTANGVPINESGNLHGNGYADTHFIIPELISSLRVQEGPFDPRQGNYAVAGSVDYQLGLVDRGLTSRTTVGSFGTYRELLLWGPKGQSEGTFAGVELYTTDGFGQNRAARRATAMAQYEAKLGRNVLRVGGSAYATQFHSAGLVRQDDYQAGRICFTCTYDPSQGGTGSRYSVWVDLESHLDKMVVRNQLFGIARPMSLRENFTGFLLDVQEPQQSEHPQRGDLIELSNMAYTVGARGSARLGGELLGQRQEIEAGYFARADFVHSVQSRIEAATGHPYETDSDLDSTLGDIGLYVDANLRPWKYIALRGGVRADYFTYDITDNCAVKSAAHASRTNPPGDASCLDQQAFGAHREPYQRITAGGLAVLPKVSLLVGPWQGLSLAASYGQGMRSIDPVYVTQDTPTSFTSAQSVDAGVSFARPLGTAERPVLLTLRSSFFQTRVNHDHQFNSTIGRDVLIGPTERDGVSGSARATGRFFDLGANVTWVRAVSTDTSASAYVPSGLLLPYVPPVVVRFDGALFGDLPWEKLRVRGKAFRASLSTGMTYVAPRPLPGNERSASIFTVDAAATVGLWLFDAGVAIQNLLDAEYRVGEYNYLSDFHSQSLPTLVPARMFSAGPPRTVLFTLSINIGGGK